MGRAKAINRVRIIRKRLGISQGKLADETGLTRVFLSRVENNRVKSIGLESAKRISKVLRVPVEELFP